MREPEELGERRPLPPTKRVRRVRVEKNGRVTLPAALARKLGADPGERIEIVEERGRIELRPNIHSLARLYIEPTSRCNLACQTCIRNTWDEPMGDMDESTFGRVVSGLDAFPHLETVMFGGFGEPMAHPRILEMVRAVKALGIGVEMTTNGTLLQGQLLEGLVRSGPDRLWVSFDGADEARFESIRKGARFRSVVDNLNRLQKLNKKRKRPLAVGISFVVMKKNVDDLVAMDELARSIGADRIIVSNVLPYSPEMEKEMLCQLTLTTDTFTFVPGKTEMSLPRLDISPYTREAVFKLLRGYMNLSLMGASISAPSRSCRFVSDRATFIRHDGRVSPCMGLLHPYKTYLYGNERRITDYGLGDIRRKLLRAIWNSKEYRTFRERVRTFGFSPCHICGGCSLVEENKEDCFGNAFPACGACLWAQGVIQCP
jgi:AbrB family looped-hinge helix DNA binding protein